MTMDLDQYRSLLAQIKRGLHSDIERRFAIGALVGKALAGGVDKTQLAKDVGVTWATLNTYFKVHQFWGDDRAPGAKSWANYSWVVDWEPAEAAEAKRRMVAGEDAREVILDTFRQRAAKRAASGMDEAWTLYYRQSWNAIRTARTMLSLALTADQEDDAVGNREMLVTEALGLISELEQAGLIPRQRRRLRRVAA